MPSVQKPLVSNIQLTASQAVLYTVSANTVTTIQAAVLTNSTGTARTVEINIVPSAGVPSATTVIVKSLTVPANGQVSVPWLILQSMVAGTSIQAAADVAAAVTVRISGVEVS